METQHNENISELKTSHSINISLPEPLSSIISKLEPQTITNFYGGPGTGKTNICLLAAIECINKGGFVTYIDTEGGFSLQRIKQLTKNPERILEKITLLEPKTFEEQGKIIRSLERQKSDLIILDSAVALYRLEYADPKAETIEAHRELSKQISVLSSIAREKNIPVIITTHVFQNWDTGESEMVGGEMMKYWSKAIVYLEKTGRASERKATIVKHRWLPEGGSVKFVIVEDGIKPSGFRIF
ncbi:MAG: DNA repair and recombination protein RadB [Candidatus Aenigmatarchaeota archaeon]